MLKASTNDNEIISKSGAFPFVAKYIASYAIIAHDIKMKIKNIIKNNDIH